MADNTVQVEEGNLNQTFPMPEGAAGGGTFEIGDKKYRFCNHCHTPKPVAQVPIADTNNPGICINCVNGIHNYDKLTWLGSIPARPNASVRKTAAVKAPKTAKILLADGTEVEGIVIAPPAPKRARRAAAAAAAAEGTEGAENGHSEEALPEGVAAPADEVPA